MKTTPQQLQAYRALKIAADRMGANNYAAQVKANKGKPPKRFHVTPEHQCVIDAMPKVLSGKISVDEAMAMLHEYETEKQRLGV